MTVRRATKADIDAMVRLRAQMFEDMGRPAGDEDAPWRAVAAQWFAEQLAGADFAAFVVDDPELGVVATAAGTRHAHAPGPTDLTGRRGHLFNVSTDPRRRRRGHARACVTALLDWFDTEAGVTVVALSATDDGIDLYTSLGFEQSKHPELRRRRGMLVS